MKKQCPSRRLFVIAVLLAMSLGVALADGTSTSSTSSSIARIESTTTTRQNVRGSIATDEKRAAMMDNDTQLYHQKKRRRVMQQNQRQRRRHHYAYPTTSYQQQQQQQQRSRKRHYKAEHTTAKLSDVWLCYAFALGWSVWFLSSFLNTDLMRYAQSNSVMVRGNVREVSIEDDSLGTGIPTYHALIDYIITVRRERDESKIQVRKSFQTQHLLQQGFANVELLVLPEEPTSSVLKEDWQREVAAQEQAEEDLVSIGGFEDIGIFGGDSHYGGGGTVGTGRTPWERGGGGTGDSDAKTVSRVDIWAKRASLIFSATLVTVSLIGAVQTVHRLPSERLQLVGWISIVFGAVFLWPLSMFILNIVSTCQRLGRLPTEKSGIILKCDTNAQVGTTLNEHYEQHMDPDITNGRHLDKVNHPGLFNHLKTPKAGNINMTREASSGIPQISVLEQSTNSDTDSACYFVKLPGNKDGQKKNILDDSSMSTISANSHISKSKRHSNTST